MSTEKQVPWIEKYNPKNLSEIYGNSNIIDRLKNILVSNNLKNLRKS